MKLGIFGSKVLSVIESCLFVRSTVHYRELVWHLWNQRNCLSDSVVTVLQTVSLTLEMFYSIHFLYMTE